VGLVENKKRKENADGKNSLVVYNQERKMLTETAVE